MINNSKTQRNIEFKHPLVSDSYLERINTSEYREQTILVLETVKLEDRQDMFGYDPYLIELLTDLESFKEKTSRKFGGIDQIDIRMH